MESRCEMRRLLVVAARILAILFSILFVFTSVVSILVANIKPNLLNANTYIHALAVEKVYARLPRIIAEQVMAAINFDPCTADPLFCKGNSPGLAGCAMSALGQERYSSLTNSVGRLSVAEKQSLKVCLSQYPSSLQSPPGGQNSMGDLAPFLQALGVTNMETILTQFLPPDELQKITDDTLLQVFAYLNGQQESATISLGNLKKHLSSPNAVNILLGVIRAQPACTFPQLEQMTTSLLRGMPDIPLCNPSDPVLNTLNGPMQDMLDAIINQVPDQVVILSPTLGANPGLPGGGLTGSFHMISLILRIVPAVPLVFLLVITLLVIRSIKTWLRWWGIPFFFSGLLAFGLAFSASFFLEQAWQNQLVMVMPPMLTAGVINLAHDLVRAILQIYLDKVYLSSAIVGVVGLGMWIGSAFIKPKNKIEHTPDPLTAN